MPRTLTAAMLTEKNQLASDHPFVFLVELDYGAGVERITNNPESITFQSLLFTGDVPFDLARFDEPGLGAGVGLQARISNANQNIVALAEQHWVGLTDPVWTVTIWLIDASAPDTTPLNANVGVYEVAGFVLDEISAQFELHEPTISTERMLPARTVTVNSGFPNARSRLL